jgi:hypothetical protein
MEERESRRFETRAIHVGQAADPATGATIVPVYQTVTYTQEAIGSHRGFEYSRTDNPTRAALEACLASLEGARFALAYGSGMAAIHGAMQLLQAGDHVVVADDLYGGSYRLFTKVMPRFGVRFSSVDATRPEEIEKAMEGSGHAERSARQPSRRALLRDDARCDHVAESRGGDTRSVGACGASHIEGGADDRRSGAGGSDRRQAGRRSARVASVGSEDVGLKPDLQPDLQRYFLSALTM